MVVYFLLSALNQEPLLNLMQTAASLANIQLQCNAKSNQLIRSEWPGDFYWFAKSLECNFVGF